MNKQGSEYVQKQKNLYKTLPAKFRVEFTESEIIERAMRCGREIKMFEAIMSNNPMEMSDDLREIATATLKEDILKYI